MLKYNDGTSTFITSASPNGLEFVSRKSLSKSNQHFTVWDTARTTLDNFVSASNITYQSKASTIGINAAVGVVSAVAYRQFPIVSGATQNVTEVGACTGEANTTAMATRLTFGAPIPVANGQRFILTYQYFNEIPLLSASFIGYSATSGVNANIAGWPSASGQFGINHVTDAGGSSDFMPKLQTRNGTGNSYFARNCYIQLHEDNRPFNTLINSTYFSSITGYINNSIRSIVNPVYTVNSFEKNWTKIYDPTDSYDFNSSNIKSIIWAGIGYNNSDSNVIINVGNFIAETYGYSILRFNFETPQTKTATQRLTITLTTRVSRDI